MSLPSKNELPFLLESVNPGLINHLNMLKQPFWLHQEFERLSKRALSARWLPIG